jgi:signal transduction histidine kinase
VAASSIEAALGPVVEVAHDMRSPLSAILFLVDMLRAGRSGAINTVQQQQLRLIHSAMLGLNQLACDLIDYVRGTERFAEDGDIKFSIAGLLHSVSEILQPVAEERGVSIELITTGEDTRIGRPALINRVILNLTSNAVRYAKRGAVLVSATPTGPDGVCFAVSDAAQTIPPELLPHLFDAFRPSTPERQSFSASGLGLAISHRLVTELGSTLEVTSSPEAGTRFQFEIDLQRG